MTKLVTHLVFLGAVVRCSNTDATEFPAHNLPYSFLGMWHFLQFILLPTMHLMRPGLYNSSAQRAFAANLKFAVTLLVFINIKILFALYFVYGMTRTFAFAFNNHFYFKVKFLLMSFYYERRHCLKSFWN